jgi:hypothetical protein
MLSDELWHVLGLQPEAVAARADFFEAFAKLVADPPSPQPRQLAELSRFSDPRPGLEAFGNLPDADEEQWFGGAEDLPAVDLPGWERAGFEADALRQAAIAALLVDTQRGLDLLRQASERYRRLNPPFAMLLQAASGPSAGPAESAFGRLNAHYFDGPDQLEVFDPIDEVQEIHLALTASSVPGIVDLETFRQFTTRAGARSAASFGSGSAAVFEWWSFVSTLLAGALRASDFPDPRSLAVALVSLARGHGRQLESARLDSFHWRKLAGIPELIDLEVASAICLTNHQLAARKQRPISPEDIDRLTDIRLKSSPEARQVSLSQLSLQVGIEMFRRNEEPPPTASTPDKPLVGA